MAHTYTVLDKLIPGTQRDSLHALAGPPASQTGIQPEIVSTDRLHLRYRLCPGLGAGLPVGTAGRPARPAAAHRSNRPRTPRAPAARGVGGSPGQPGAVKIVLPDVTGSGEQRKPPVKHTKPIQRGNYYQFLFDQSVKDASAQARIARPTTVNGVEIIKLFASPSGCVIDGSSSDGGSFHNLRARRSTCRLSQVRRLPGRHPAGHPPELRIHKLAGRRAIRITPVFQNPVWQDPHITATVSSTC